MNIPILNKDLSDVEDKELIEYLITLAVFDWKELKTSSQPNYHLTEVLETIIGHKRS